MLPHHLLLKTLPHPHRYPSSPHGIVPDRDGGRESCPGSPREE